jgi:nitrate reductase molybdenum cofactor assembly chaperone NarJ/NarW
MKLTDHEQRVAHQAASFLLSYPDKTLLAQLGVLRRMVATLPEPVGAPLSQMVAHLAKTTPAKLEADYVETFDLRRRCSPYLTYFTYGDTRNRGYALLRFQSAYRLAGMMPPADELADHLAVVLEFSARGHSQTAKRLLREHRAGLELFWRALVDAGSPYADVVTAVRATLPEPSARAAATMRKLASQGPPSESVGIDEGMTPYGWDAG